MFDILVYLFENYYTPQACPAADVLAKRLAAAGFEHEDIDDALGWLYGLAETTERCVDLAQVPNTGTRIYTDNEYQQLGSESIGFIAFLESAGVLPAPREIVIDRGLASPETPVPLTRSRSSPSWCSGARKPRSTIWSWKSCWTTRACGACDRGRAAGRPPFCPFLSGAARMRALCPELICP